MHHLPSVGPVQDVNMQLFNQYFLSRFNTGTVIAIKFISFLIPYFLCYLPGSVVFLFYLFEGFITAKK